jgi:hypothetical protein
MAESNYTLKLTLAEAQTIKSLLTDRKTTLEKAIPVTIGENKAEAERMQRDYAIVERLWHRL